MSEAKISKTYQISTNSADGTLGALTKSNSNYQFEFKDGELVGAYRIDTQGGRSGTWETKKQVNPDSKEWEQLLESDAATNAYNEAIHGKNTDNYIDDINDDTSAGGTKIASSEELGKYYRQKTNSQTNEELVAEGEKNKTVVKGQELKDEYDKQREGYKKTTVFRYPFDMSIRQDHLEISRYNYARGSIQGSRPPRLVENNVKEPFKWEANTMGGNAQRKKKAEREYIKSGPEIEYEKKKGDSMKGSKYFGTVFLPMPKVVDTNGAEWGKSELNILGLAAASLGQDLGKLGLDQQSQDELEKAKSIIGAGDKTSKLKDIGGAFAGQFYASAVARATGQNVSTDQLLARASGRVLNPNAEMLFGGPVLRDFNFDFTMISRSPEEGKEIRKIIKFFKEGMAPKFNNSTFLTTPDIFILKYKRSEGYDSGVINTVNRFNPGGLALRTIAVDYAPNGYWSAYQDSQPVAVKMSLNFAELRPIYQEDQFETPEDSVGY
tara:strand:- start:21 stop:1502 length:1482 start_codon:yes stop_codon:yes gene_type:complete